MIMTICNVSFEGVHSIAYAFPHVKVVTTAVDPEINERFHVLPGIGNFGDRCCLNIKVGQKYNKFLL